MGLLFDIATKREMLFFKRYCELRDKQSKDEKDRVLMSRLVAQIYILDEELKTEKANKR
ncbi:hypothetical protein [Crassaminicella thermophila]|uniref:hypothetical protein n=1 Tax=Crassaminicella thermophila TaxID=2599308 RepID=UPI00143D6E3D|nr:hypothetical protein [Crassaminicella thermophila]